METRHLIIKGRVQGVSYRAWSVQAATQLGLNGWVRNLKNGDVEAVIQGHTEDIQKFITSCYDGPMMARVDSVSIKTIRDSKKFSDFEFRQNNIL
tara:strand:+ start:1065 stop:1349 length:285 start_codon:yes stop_codon:yes gene_type:complete